MSSHPHPGDPDRPVPMDSPERCFLTELLTSQCGHCRQPSAPVFAEAPFTTPSDSDTVSDIVTVFRARWPGRCVCDEPFDEGDWIARTREGDYLCEECRT